MAAGYKSVQDLLFTSRLISSDLGLLRLPPIVAV